MRKLLVVDASPWTTDKISALLGKYYHVYTASDPELILDMVESIRPDVLVIDLMLHGVDSMEILRMIHLTHIRPVIIVTSFYVPERILEELDKLSVACVMEKPFLYHALVARILELDRPGQSGYFGIANTFLLKIGFRPDLQGYKLLLACLIYVMEHPGCSMTKELYPVIAKKMLTTHYHVERACRDCIAKAWAERDLSLWSKYFPENRVRQKKPISNGVFLGRVAAWLVGEKSQ